MKKSANVLLAPRVVRQRIDTRHPMGATCAYNPVVGKENILGWLDLIPTSTPKKVMVIGGGTAGLEAARIAATTATKPVAVGKGARTRRSFAYRGKSAGQVRPAGVPRYQKYQMKLLNVDVHLNAEVTADIVVKEKPDVAIVATGSFVRMPRDIIGIDQPNVTNVRDVLDGKVEVGENVLIVDSQRFLQGLTTANFLAEKDKTVEVIFPDLKPGRRCWRISQR